MNSYNISDLFKIAFGLTVDPYNISTLNKSIQDNQKYKGITLLPTEKVERLSHLGTPILHPIKFEKGNYKTYNEKGEIIMTGLSDLYLPPTTLVDFKRAKILSRSTAIQGVGTVKELYGFDDWKIRIRGLCLNTPSNTARQQINELLKWEKVASGVDVVAKFFNDKGIYSIAIESIEIKQIAGKPSVIPFTILADSTDNDLQLIETKPSN
ncbi:DUF6046 domain-containing protein [Maribacter ulvicola]|uniref:DUF6046 domain-containing protein n=1 Tax=Maribacter ulvicola TaxID=228959 RepID=A0A1N6V8P2_9FLAO|nr:DUF6046 domain-containing protein [Maribacter ulvicola]SIQ74253.1 hypothetical protein SAMN05421797_10336 [Maribacter ulvicola]